MNQMQAEVSGDGGKTERGWKPNVEISPNCPRCGSPNTKFCYYNNYSSTQPRYFCKGCRRYWTKGGALRSVPVGGGCRKSRRGNKTLRQSIDGIEQSGDVRTTSSPNSSMVSDGPNIDLAQVYANFLNQKPDSTADLEKPYQMKPALDPTLEYSSLSSTDVGPNTAWLEEFGLSGCLDFYESTESHFSEGNVQMYLCGFDSIQKHQEYRIDQFSNHDTTNFELPPLPGEEAHDMLRSDSEMMINHALQDTQMPLFGPEAHDADLLVGNWSPFDFPRDASFSSP